MDGSTVSMNADAATTANEVCRKVAERINLAEKFGFSLFISMFGKVRNDGHIIVFDVNLCISSSSLFC